MTRAAIYARISRDKVGEALGVARQEADCRKLCADRGWEVIEPPYIDNDVSAYDPSKTRAHYERLLRDIAAGRVDAVAVWDLDRLHRRPMELEEFTLACERAGVTQLATVTSIVDMGTGDGMLVARIKGAVAAEEVRKTTARIRRKKLELAERGLPSGGGRAFGYARDGMTIVEPEAAMIREAANKVLDGATLASIRDRWQASGIPPVGGGVWSTKSVRNTLIRPRYCGDREHNKVVIGFAAWPAILQRDTWESVNAILSNPERRNAPTNARYPLKGLLECGECGNTMPAMPRGHTRMYGCRKSLGGTRCGHVQVTADPVEEYVLPRLRKLASNPKVRELLESENEASANEVRALVAERAKHAVNLRRIEDDYGDGKINAATHGRQCKRIQSRIDPLEMRIATIRANTMLGRLGPNLDLAWPQMTVDEQQQVLKLLVSAIKVRRATAGNRFDPRRVSFIWRSEAVLRAADLVLGSGDEVLPLAG